MEIEDMRETTEFVNDGELNNKIRPIPHANHHRFDVLTPPTLRIATNICCRYKGWL